MMYTVVKCFFNSHGEIERKHYLNLEPMTHREALTFRSKQMKPSEWMLERVDA